MINKVLYSANRAAAMVEMMLVLPLIILVYSVIFDIGRAAQVSAIAASAARAAVQYAVFHQPPTATLTPAFGVALQQAIQNDAGTSGISLSSASVSCSCFPNSSTDSCSYHGQCSQAADHPRNKISVNVTGSYISISPIHFITTNKGVSIVTESMTMQLPG